MNRRVAKKIWRYMDKMCYSDRQIRDAYRVLCRQNNFNKVVSNVGQKEVSTK